MSELEPFDAGDSGSGAMRWVLSAGLMAGGAVATAGARRYARARAVARPDPLRKEPLGSLHTEPIVVTADDGVELIAEVEEPVGAPAGAPSIVFLPGFCLPMDCWHFQRRDLRDLGRLVFYDQRAHGRSGRGASQNATIEQLAEDLRAVLERLVPEGPIVLVGHSLGGMVVMAFADEHAKLFGDRIVGVALLTTSPGRLAEMTLGLPAALMQRLWPVAPVVVDRVATNPLAVRRGMKADRGIGLMITRRLSFGRADVPTSLVKFAGRLLSSTPLDVFAEFFAEFDRHDKEHALPVLQSVPTLIIAAERDMLTPAEHSRAMAAVLPEAELLVIPECGHLVQLEDPDAVNAALRRLLDRVHLSAEAAESHRRMEP
jgi:pimeloyl-ACP methyl ester carboxylesterase